MAIWLLHGLQAMAQSRTVQGKVFSQEDGSYIPGVSVVLKGTTIGAATDIEGHYQVSVPEEGGTLVFSFIGLQKQEIPIGNQTEVNVTLLPDSKQLTEVVVTALGFTEEADKVAATSSKVTGESIQKSGEANVISSLAGKASGVQIVGQSGDPGAGSFIQIRGQNSITGSTEPLIVLDGVPISNSIHGAGQGGVVQQSRLNDINPNDIASMQILKGASAAALWGSRAANGVIIITTKKGQDSNKLNLSFSSSVSFDRVNAFHPFQTSYGQGMNGVYNPTNANSWGDKIADRSGTPDEVNTSAGFFEAEDGTRYYPITNRNSRDVYVDDNINNVFGTGHFWDKSLSMSGGDEKTNYFFSLGDLSQQGIYNGNSDYRRTTIRLNASRKFNKVVKISNNMNFIKTFSNRIERGNNTSGAMLGLLRTPPDFYNHHYKGSYYTSPTASPILGRQRSYRLYLGNSNSPVFNNPEWALSELTNTSGVNRFINSFDLNIKPVEWFDLTTRVGLDSYFDERYGNSPINDVSGAGNGSFSRSIQTETEINLDVIGRVVKEFGEDFSATWITGFNVNDRKYSNLGGSLNNFLVPEAPANFINATAENRTPTNSLSKIRVARVYSTVGLAAFNMLYVNVSLAGESASSFGELSEKTFYYPSADIAWDFSNIGPLVNSAFLSFGKLRAAYGVVGVQPLPYRSNTTFTAASYSTSPWGDNLSGAVYGGGAFLLDTELGDPRLKPERKTEYELGTDLRLLNNRLKTSLTYYHNRIDDLLIPVTLAPSVGYGSTYTNAASMENKGWEADLGVDVLRGGNVNWNVYANFNQNRNQVTNLAGTESLYLTGRDDRVDMRAVVGQPAGIFWGGRFERDEQGVLNLNENSFPIAATTLGVIGDPNPDWRGGLGTSLSFKGLSLDVLFETSQGGDYASLTKGVMYAFGTHADVGKEVTLTQDLKNYAGETIPAGSTVRGNIHDFGGGPVLLDQSYYVSLGSGLGSAPEQFIEDGSWTRLRQVSLSYALTSEGFKQATKLQSLELSVTGRNLFLWTKVVGIDPDTNFTGDLYGRSYDYFNSPGTRSFLFSVKANF